MKNAKNSPISHRIKYIFDAYYQERAVQKFRSISQQYDEFLEGLDLSDEFEAYVGDFAIRSLVTSYYLDVIRYKEYHFNPSGTVVYSTHESETWIEAVHNKRISRNKAAAYTAKWLIRYSPIWIFPDKNRKVLPEEQEKILNANAMFCIVNIRSILVEEPSISRQLEKNEVIADMVYHLRFRMFDERHFFRILDPFRETLDLA